MMKTETGNTRPSLADELRKLRQLAKDRRAASIVLLRNRAKPFALLQANGLPRRRGPVVA